MHVSISGTANNIKIICSIRFSLFITIDRFYKLFLAEGAFVNRRPETISPLFFIPLPPSNLRPFGAPPFRGRREYPREPLPLEGGAERSEAGLASFFGGARVLSYNRALETISPLFFIPLEPYPARSARHLPHAGKALLGETVFSFLHPSHAKTTVSYERPFLCVLLA